MSELAVIEHDSALTLFSAPNGLDPIIGKVRAEIDTFMADPKRGDITTAAGRDERASFAYKVAKSKTYLDSVGKDLVAELKLIPAKIDAERKRVRETLDAWKDEVRKPLTDWEEAEKARVQAHEMRLSQIVNYAEGFGGESASALSIRLNSVKAFQIDESWQEFKAKAAWAQQEALRVLSAAHDAAVKREADEAELNRLRAETAARLRREQEERIAAEAADKARKEADARAAAAAEQAEREAAERLAASERAAKEQAEAAARKAKQEADAAAKREADLKQQREQAEREKQAAIERAAKAEKEAKEKAERDHAAKLKAEAAETARREANKAHLKKINRAALDALVAGGVPEDMAKLAITMIAAKKIPAITINY